jgi:hypothetical protein
MHFLSGVDRRKPQNRLYGKRRSGARRSVVVQRDGTLSEAPWPQE